MSATVKDMVMRLTSHVGAKRVVLLKHKYVDHTQIDFLRGNDYRKASVHLNRSCSRVRLARCQEVLQFSANGFTNLKPEKGKRQLGSRSRSQAILTPVSDPTPTMKKAYHRHMMVVSESNDGSLAGKSFQEHKDLAAQLSALCSKQA